jgi:hypothetical protein
MCKPLVLQNVGAFSTFYVKKATVLLLFSKKDNKNNAKTKKMTSKAIINIVLKKSTSGNRTRVAPTSLQHTTNRGTVKNMKKSASVRLINSK